MGVGSGEEHKKPLLSVGVWALGLCSRKIFQKFNYRFRCILTGYELYMYIFAFQTTECNREGGS